jgi:predicted negative regulator of RcsB-dependent stress response
MAYDLQEQEQIDELKAFWKRYGNFLMTVITLILLAIAGWRGWGWWQARQAAEAAAIYDQLRAAVTAKDTGRVRESAGAIFEKYGSTVYGQMAALLAARAYLDAGDAKAARVPLQWAIDHASDESFRHIARIRLAGVLLDEKALDQALGLLSASPPDRFQGLYADRRGDILLMQNKPAEARAEYRKALEKLALDSPLRSVVQMKLDALGVQEGA